MLNPALYSLFLPVSKIPGVGPKTAEAFKRLEIYSILDLLFHKPCSVIDRRYMPPLHQAKLNDVITQVVRVIAIRKGATKRAPARITCSNSTGQLELIYFNYQEQIITKFAIGDEIAVSGKVQAINSIGIVEIAHPDIVTGAANLDSVKIVEPVYPSTYGTTSKYISNAVKRAEAMIPDLQEWLPAATVEKFSLPKWRDALVMLHNPTGELETTAASIANSRLALDEILTQQLKIMSFRSKVRKEPKAPLRFNSDLKNKLLANLPFKLTDDQLQAIADIELDQAANEKMMRLIQGDVGCGKTLVALIAMLNCFAAGKKSIIMVPTELLALQHYSRIREYVENLGVKVILMISNLKGSEKKENLEQFSASEPAIIIGTHALFQDKVEYENVGLVIIDEQHRFGVEQREKLLRKGRDLDFLMMTATPIPRTLAMTSNGDLDITMIKNKPAARKPIKTVVMAEDKLESVIEGLKRAIDNGEKAYWVCPLISESETLDLAHVEERYQALAIQFGDLIGIIHGRIPIAERDITMERFKSGEIKILVATSVIEVGVDVSDATIMIIENAERFGLSQLHQIRGRVGRSELSSSCVLVYGQKLSKNGWARLQALRESNDGFYLAERDLQIRGSGEVLGTKQSGLPDFKFFDIFAHEHLLFEANKIARSLVIGGSMQKEHELLLQLFASTEKRV